MMPQHTIGLFIIGIIANACALATALIYMGRDLPSWHMGVLVTARLSLMLFLVVLLARKLAGRLPCSWTLFLLRERRGLGLAFFGALSVHVATTLVYIYKGGIPPQALAVLGDGVGFALVTAMAITSNELALRRLGARKWGKLHTFGLYWIWGVFEVTYLSRLTVDFFHGLACVTILAAAIFRQGLASKLKFHLK